MAFPTIYPQKPNPSEATIWGFSAVDLVIEDEAARVSDETYLASLAESLRSTSPWATAAFQIFGLVGTSVRPGVEDVHVACWSSDIGTAMSVQGVGCDPPHFCLWL